MSSQKLSYKEGDWIAVPLVKRGGWGLGLIARLKAPAIFGYFFGPRRAQPPNLEDTIGLTLEDALLVAQTGNLGLRKGEWQVVGSQASWARRSWPMPKFWRQEGARFFLVKYDEENPSRDVSEEQISREQSAGYPEDIVSGHVALSIKLDNAIAEQEARTAA